MQLEEGSQPPGEIKALSGGHTRPQTKGCFCDWVLAFTPYSISVNKINFLFYFSINNYELYKLRRINKVSKIPCEGIKIT